MDEYFKKLDNAPIFPDSLFKNNEEKENYETKLMFSFRKYQAAQYHFQNVIKYLKEEEDNIVFMKEDRELIKKSIIISGTIELPANHYVYELSAFLEAMKSSIDFLATVASLHLKGKQFDKISSLMKMVRKNRIDPIFNQIKNHFDWLSYLREYRHHLVHRSIINISKEYKTLKIYDSLKTYTRPIIIHEKSLKYIPDTRRSRMLDMGSSHKFAKLEIKTQLGNESVTTHFEYLPIIGYIPIEKFMEKQLNKFKLFFNDFINVLTSLEFKQV